MDATQRYQLSVLPLELPAAPAAAVVRRRLSPPRRRAGFHQVVRGRPRAIIVSNHFGRGGGASMKQRGLIALVLSAILASAAGTHPAAAQAEKLGKVNFPISCSAGVQPQFDRAVALLHSFWFDYAI